MNRLAEPQQNGNTFGFTAWRGLTTTMAAPHAHNDIEVNFSARQLVYSSADKTSWLPAGVPCAFWGAKPHQLVEVDGAHPLAFVTIPLAQFMSWAVPDSVKNRLLHGDVLVGPTDFAHQGLPAAFERWMLDLHQHRTLARRAAEREIEGLLYRMALGSWAEKTVASSRSSLDLRRAAQMATFIAENAATGIRVADVAQAVHVHPNRAAALFRDVFGVSVLGYLAQFRVAEAQRMLLTTDLSSAAIGAAVGFNSPSSYHETFAAVCGSSPAAWRRHHRSTITAQQRVTS